MDFNLQNSVHTLVYEGTMSRYEAAEAYGISDNTARDHMRMYRDSNSLSPKSSGNNTGCYVYKPSESRPDISDYESMTKKGACEVLSVSYPRLPLLWQLILMWRRLFARRRHVSTIGYRPLSVNFSI